MKKSVSLIIDKSTKGGAIIAAARIAKILKKNFKIEYKLSKKKNYFHKIKVLFSKVICRIFIRNENFLNSLNLFSRVDIEKIKGNLINIHWIGNEIVSLNDLINTKKTIVWTMHDLWPMTSTEHFLNNHKAYCYNTKNLKNNLLKKIIYRKKKKLFKKKNIYLISNSRWLENFAKKSDLTKNIKIRTIYNPVETNIWKRQHTLNAKKKLKLDDQKKYIFFGAQGGINNIRKGGEIFLESLKFLNSDLENLEVIVLGGEKNYKDKINGIICNFRKLEKNKKKQLLYHSVSSVTVAASKAESLPQFVVETILCRNPVASFDVGGINEIVAHRKNGYISKNINPNSLSKGISYCLNSINKKDLIVSENKLRKMFDEKKIANEYKNYIKKIIEV